MLAVAVGWEQEAAQERIKLGFISSTRRQHQQAKEALLPYKWALFVIQADTDSSTKQLR